MYIYICNNDSTTLWTKSIIFYKNTLFVGLLGCLYPINVKTAEPIGPNI